MKNKFFYISLILSLIVLLVNIIAYPVLPEKVPVHWGLNGEPNRYGPKLESFALGALPLILVFFLNILPSIDPKKESYKIHTKAYSILILISVIFVSGIDLISLGSILGFNVKVSIFLPIFLGLFFIIMGNYITQIRPNYFVGIRTPWTLSSEHVWRKTHRFGGYVFIVIGLVTLFSILIGSMGMEIFLGALIIGAGAIFLYSYLIFIKGTGK